MRKSTRRPFILHLLLLLVPALLWTSCSEEQLFPGNARVKTRFRLTSPTALDGSIAIQQAYLKLEGISVTGALGGENAPEANYPVPAEDPPYRLTQSDTAQVSLTLPTGAYDEMDLHLFLLQTDYQLIVHQKPSGEPPPPVDNNNGEPTGGDTDPTPGNGGDGSTGEDDEENGQEHDGNTGQQDDDDGRDEDDDREGDDSDDESDQDEDKDDDDKGNHQKKGDDDGKKNKDDKGKKDKKGNDDDRDDDDDEQDDDDGDRDRRTEDQTTGSVDLDHFFQHAKPSLVVFANWTIDGRNVNIIFAVTGVERITLRATQNDGPRITVDEHGRGTVNFNPERWFDSISAANLENATLQDYQGQPVLFIHQKVNTPLFEVLLNNLRNSTVFEVAGSATR